jgi:predicted HTH transcriptional regulator
MEFFYRVYNKVQKDIKVPFALDGIVRVDDTPVHKAVREALVNCLVNADYYQPRGVVVKKDADTLIIENPGSIRTGKNQMLRGGISDPRNETILKMFNLIGYGERAGSGVPDIYSVWEKEGWEEPSIVEQYGPDRTVLTLSFKNKSSIKSGDKKVAIKSGDKKVAIKVTAKKQAQYDAILEYMLAGKEYKASEFEQVLGVKTSRIKVILSEMINAGLIEPDGENKNRVYRLKHD